MLSGLYINVMNDGARHVELWSCKNGDTPASQWTPKQQPGGAWSFQSHTGHWMNVKNDGGVHTKLWTAENGSCAASRFKVYRITDPKYTAVCSLVPVVQFGGGGNGTYEEKFKLKSGMKNETFSSETTTNVIGKASIAIDGQTVGGQFSTDFKSATKSALKCTYE